MNKQNYSLCHFPFKYAYKKDTENNRVSLTENKT